MSEQTIPSYEEGRKPFPVYFFVFMCVLFLGLVLFLPVLNGVGSYKISAPPRPSKLKSKASAAHDYASASSSSAQKQPSAATARRRGQPGPAGPYMTDISEDSVAAAAYTPYEDSTPVPDSLQASTSSSAALRARVASAAKNAAKRASVHAPELRFTSAPISSKSRPASMVGPNSRVSFNNIDPDFDIDAFIEQEEKRDEEDRLRDTADMLREQARETELDRDAMHKLTQQRLEGLA